MVDLLTSQVAAKEETSPEMDVRKRPGGKVEELGLLGEFKQVKQDENVEDDGGFPPRGKLEAEEMINLFHPVVGSAPRLSMPTDDAAANQLTIFYSGSINVYDAVTPDKAHAIMLIAAAAAAANVRNSKAVTAAPTAKPELMRSPALPGACNLLTKLQEELPIARRHSLQRFLEKRRDRIVTKAPYTMAKPADSKETEEASSQLGGSTGSPSDQKAVPSPVAANMA